LRNPLRKNLLNSRSDLKTALELHISNSTNPEPSASTGAAETWNTSKRSPPRDDNIPPAKIQKQALSYRVHFGQYKGKRLSKAHPYVILRWKKNIDNPGFRRSKPATMFDGNKSPVEWTTQSQRTERKYLAAKTKSKLLHRDRQQREMGTAEASDATKIFGMDWQLLFQIPALDKGAKNKKYYLYHAWDLFKFSTSEGKANEAMTAFLNKNEDRTEGIWAGMGLGADATEEYSGTAARRRKPAVARKEKEYDAKIDALLDRALASKGVDWWGEGSDWAAECRALGDPASHDRDEYEPKSLHNCRSIAGTVHLTTTRTSPPERQYLLHRAQRRTLDEKGADRRFSELQYRFDFGAHKNKALFECPPSYIKWLVKENVSASSGRADLKPALERYFSIMELYQPELELWVPKKKATRRTRKRALSSSREDDNPPAKIQKQQESSDVATSEKVANEEPAYVIPFGHHQGQKLSEVPRDFVHWVTQYIDKPTFNPALRAALQVLPEEVLPWKCPERRWIGDMPSEFLEFDDPDGDELYISYSGAKKLFPLTDESFTQLDNPDSVKN
ncbi:uncharacterized protein PAC_17806, partial [Phialocephala subalpina]